MAEAVRFVTNGCWEIPITVLNAAAKLLNSDLHYSPENECSVEQRILNPYVYETVHLLCSYNRDTGYIVLMPLQRSTSVQYGPPHR